MSISESIVVACQVFGLGFVISLGMAVIIKVSLKVIRIFLKEDKESSS